MNQMQQDWQQLAQAQFSVAAQAQSKTIATQLYDSPLNTLGDYVQSRIKAAAYYSPLVLPEHQWETIGFAMSYFIGWVFGLDELMDNCSDISYIEDLITMITALMSNDNEIDWDSLDLTNPASEIVPGVEFSLSQFVDALTVLRQNLSDNAATETGPRLFDKCMLEQVLPAMRTEAIWRINDTRIVDFDNYLENGSYSICGIISVGLVDSILPDSDWYWDIGWIPTKQLGYATRLFNDIATRFRDEDEGRINAITLYAQHTNCTIEEATNHIEKLMDKYCSDIERLCLPHIKVAQHDDPLYTMYYYIFYCGVISRMMYMKGDFVSA